VHQTIVTDAVTWVSNTILEKLFEANIIIIASILSFSDELDREFKLFKDVPFDHSTAPSSKPMYFL
jgi:hypothetical protein